MPAHRHAQLAARPSKHKSAGAVQTAVSEPQMQRDPRLVEDFPERLSLTHRVMSQPDLNQEAPLPRKKSWLARTFSRKKKNVASAGNSPLAGMWPCVCSYLL